MVQSGSKERIKITAPVKDESMAQKDKMPGKKKNKGLTPYQGKNRAFGYFYCPDCDKEWTSANSWANCYQICKECDLAVYPHRQYRLERSKGAPKKKKPHPMELCQRCIETGTGCWLNVDWSPRKS